MPMGSPKIASAWRLMGKTRVRRGWFGRIVIQVQEGRRHGYAQPRGPEYDEWIETRWRDATIYDLHDMRSGEAVDESSLLPKPSAPRVVEPIPGLRAQ
jgi:hypothetical protein